MIATLCVSLFLVLMLTAAWTDLAGFRIPNWIPGALIAIWPVAAWAMGMGWSEAGYALLTFVIVLALAVGLWMPGFIGGGDAKLIAAVALWFAWPGVLVFVLWSVIAGGALAVLLLALRRIAPALPLQPEWVARSPLAEGAPAPYAVALAAGALIALPQTTLIAAFGP
jgi:prepilin peptidase CpaA